MLETTALGAAVAAGSAKGVEVWNVSKIQATPNDIFTPSISADGMYMFVYHTGKFV